MPAESCQDAVAVQILLIREAMAIIPEAEANQAINLAENIKEKGVKNLDALF